MQKTLLTKLTIIVGLCVIFVVGLMMFRTVITERQYYAQSVVKEISQQHVNPQEIITPFIIIPTTITPECSIVGEVDVAKCKSAYSSMLTVFANKTSATQDLEVSTDTYRRGIYHATSYNGALKFDQSYTLSQTLQRLIDDNNSASNNFKTVSTADNSTNTNTKTAKPEKTDIHWNAAKLIIPVSDLRGVATLPTVTINKQAIKATYPQTTMLNGLSYVEVPLTKDVLDRLTTTASQQEQTNLAAENLNNDPLNRQSPNIEILSSQTPSSQNPNNQESDNQQSGNSLHQTIDIVVDLPLYGISTLNTVPTGQNFELSMRSNWHAPNFIGKALPNAKTVTSSGFEAKWQNQYLTIANNQRLSQCVSIANDQCTVTSSAALDITDQYIADEAITAAEDTTVSNSDRNVRLSSFGVSFAEPNDVYLQTERTMKYALLLILVSFGTFFLFEVLKSSRIHPIQYLLVGCALLCFYILLLPLAEQIVFWQAYAIAASACVGLIGWYTYYVLDGIKRASIFTTILGGLYAAFYGILTTEDLNLLLGAIFCFVLLACVMVMTRKIDWYKVT